MSEIEIKRAHTLAKDDARLKAEELAKALEAKLGLSWHWNGDSIHFEAAHGVARGTRGEVHVTPQEVKVHVHLPFMLRPIKGMLESRVHEKLDQLL